MSEHKFFRIEYTGRIKESNDVMDESKDAPIVLDSDWIWPALNDAIKEMKVGDEKTIELEPEKTFGPRMPELIKMVPEREFKKHDTEPMPGMWITADNMRGKVLSVSGGRVRVDFNHPLAGKVLVYSIKIKQDVENFDDKVKCIVDFHAKQNIDHMKVSHTDKELEIIMPPLVNSVYKKKMADDFFKYLGFEKVKFSEVYERHEQK
ncbi:MAG TPA: peptidylprolyl isomerase [archaeon]|nr:peptidylprolyl isomerase [archaeon]